MIGQYDNFFLPVDDLDIAKDFYRKKLGLEIKFDFPEKEMVAFNVGDNEPAIILRKKNGSKPTIWFEVDDVRQTCQELKLRGVQFLTEPFEIATGFSVEFADPFGNIFGLADYSKIPQLAGQKG